jgi:hypothetical protein
MVTASEFTALGMSTLASGKKARSTEKAPWSFRTRILMTATGGMMTCMEWGITSGTRAMSIAEGLSKTNGMEREPLS